MKILVTGASGFLGKNFLLSCKREWEVDAFYFSSKDFPRFLEENGLKNVNPVKCDLRDYEAVKRVSEKRGKYYDVVLYMAGNTDPTRSVSEPIFDYESNVKALINFLENISCEKMIYFSSGAVYDGLKGKVSPESKLSPSLPYAVSKLTAENYVRIYHTLKNSIKKYVIVRFFGAYGPYEPKRKIYTKLVKSFAIKRDREFTIRGNGENYIDAMFVADAVKGINSMINTDIEKNVVVDFGTGHPITINELVERTAKTFNIDDVKIKHTGNTAEYISFSISDQDMIKIFNFKPKMKLEDGLKILSGHLKHTGNI